MLFRSAFVHSDDLFDHPGQILTLFLPGFLQIHIGAERTELFQYLQRTFQKHSGLFTILLIHQMEKILQILYNPIRQLLIFIPGFKIALLHSEYVLFIRLVYAAGVVSNPAPTLLLPGQHQIQQMRNGITGVHGLLQRVVLGAQLNKQGAGTQMHIVAITIYVILSGEPGVIFLRL